MDISHNNFGSVPKNISTYKLLRYLNISHNKLTYLDSTSLQGLDALEELVLSHNLLTDWRDIHTDALTHTPSLNQLDLSFNSLRGFPDIIEDYPLKSDSLETLYLINCSISNLLGDVLLGTTNLKRLFVSQNPLIALNTQIKSEKLHTLDLSLCNLQRIQPDAFTELTSLQELILARNYQLKKFNSRSNSLKFLDLSHCNLESVPASSLPNLTKVYFKGNHLRHIPANSFASFPSVHVLDLSNNAIIKLDVKAFHDLKSVESIDLSVNTISTIDPETFMSNLKLHKLNLSRNYLSKVGQLIIESLRWLDLSVCEIQEISRDSLIMMPKLQKLNLSRNLISHIPNRLQADELSVLDLSMCRIYTLNNLTFISMGRLRSLNLSGNRLVSGIKPSFFHRITDVKLHDNSWFCDCNSNDFRELYTWVFYGVSSTSTLRCRSPENLAGFTWQGACQEVWFAPGGSRSDTMWVYSLLLVIVMTFLCCIVMSVRHVYHRKAVRQREAQEQEREEARERLRRIHQRNLQYSRESMNRNAPDPRELQTPPSYAEAVSMPRLNVSCSSLAGSHRSLHSLHSSHPDISSRRTKLRRKRRRSRHENKASVSETQSVASLSHANTDVSNSEDELRPNAEDRNVIESSF